MVNLSFEQKSKLPGPSDQVFGLSWSDVTLGFIRKLPIV